MSMTLVVVPVIGVSALPVLTSIAAAAGASLGYTLKRGLTNAARLQKALKEAQKQRVEVDVDATEVPEELLNNEIVLQRGDVTATLRIGPNGKLQVCMDSPNATKEQLEEEAKQLAGRLLQQYAYHRFMTECEQLNLPVLEQEVLEDNSIRIVVRV